MSTKDVWDPKVNDGATRGGLSVTIFGDDGVRYYGSHLSAIDPALVRATAAPPRPIVEAVIVDGALLMDTLTTPSPPARPMETAAPDSEPLENTVN